MKKNINSVEVDQDKDLGPDVKGKILSVIRKLFSIEVPGVLTP